MTKELTFKELKEMVAPVDWEKLEALYEELGFYKSSDNKSKKRHIVPTPKFLRENSSIVLEKDQIKVYASGFVVYFSEGRHCVLELHKCKEYNCQFVTNETRTYSEDFLDCEPWHIPLLLFLEDKLEKNQESRRSENNVISYSAVAEDWEVMKDTADDILTRIIQKEEIQEILSLLDDRQLTALTMYYCQEKSQSEIADALHIKQQNVSYLIKSTITYLRKELGCNLKKVIRVRHNK